MTTGVASSRTSAPSRGVAAVQDQQSRRIRGGAKRMGQQSEGHSCPSGLSTLSCLQPRGLANVNGEVDNVVGADIDQFEVLGSHVELSNDA